MDTSIKIEVNLSKIFTDPGYSTKLVNQAMQGSMYIAEEEYVDESPGDQGDWKQEIKVKRVRDLVFDVVNEARSKRGFSYPVAVQMGTGRYKGGADTGYTSGRVRISNNYGFGLSVSGRERAAAFFGRLYKLGRIKGIKPNKVAERATKQSEDRVVSKVSELINRGLNK